MKIKILSAILVAVFFIGGIALVTQKQKLTIAADSQISQSELAKYLVPITDLPAQKNYSIIGEVQIASEYLTPKKYSWSWVAKGVSSAFHTTSQDVLSIQTNARKYILVPYSPVNDYSASLMSSDYKYVIWLSSSGVGTTLDIASYINKGPVVISGDMINGYLDATPPSGKRYFAKILVPKKIVSGFLDDKAKFTEAMNILYGGSN